MDKNILVVGGYGDVGRRICLKLAEHFPGKVIAAGRNYAKAQTFSRQTEGKVLASYLDVTNNWDDHNLSNVHIVIMSLDLPTADFARSCLQAGIHYIDITASYSLIQDIKNADDLAKSSGATGVVSVGLDPGISNLLVKQCFKGIHQKEKAEINILLGLGEDHGDGSIDWILDNLQCDYTLKVNGTPKQIISFHSGKWVTFPDGLGRHVAYAFNFSDQHVLPETLGVPDVRTRMCFESKGITRLGAMLSRIRFFKLFKYQVIRKIFKYLLKNLKMGSDVYAVKVSVSGFHNDMKIYRHAAVLGNCEAQATAESAALTALWLASNQPLPGVFHIEEIIEPEDILGKIIGMRLYGEADTERTRSQMDQLPALS